MITSGKLIPKDGGGYRFAFDAMEAPRDIEDVPTTVRYARVRESAQRLLQPEPTTEQRAAEAFRQRLTDEATAFICGGFDRERHLRWNWLSASGLTGYWRATNFGLKSEGRKSDA